MQCVSLLPVPASTAASEQKPSTGELHHGVCVASAQRGSTNVTPVQCCSAVCLLLSARLWVFWSAFDDVSSKKSPQVPVPVASGMRSAPAAAHQRMVSRTAFQNMGSQQPGNPQNMLGILMWHTGLVSLLHCFPTA